MGASTFGLCFDGLAGDSGSATVRLLAHMHIHTKLRMRQLWGRDGRFSARHSLETITMGFPVKFCVLDVSFSARFPLMFEQQNMEPVGVRVERVCMIRQIVLACIEHAWPRVVFWRPTRARARFMCCAPELSCGQLWPNVGLAFCRTSGPSPPLGSQRSTEQAA